MDLKIQNYIKQNEYYVYDILTSVDGQDKLIGFLGIHEDLEVYQCEIRCCRSIQDDIYMLELIKNEIERIKIENRKVMS